MKNKILILLMVCGIMMLSGCTNSRQDRVVDVAPTQNRFVDTGQRYGVDGVEYSVYEDTKTGNLYLFTNNGSYGSTICPLVE